MFPIVVALRQWESVICLSKETYSVLLDNAHGQPSVSGCAFRSGDKLQPATVIAGALCQIPAPNNGVKNLQDTSENTSVPLKCHETILTCFCELLLMPKLRTRESDPPPTAGGGA